MIKCSLVRDLLPLYIDKETSGETTAQIMEHLDTCTRCREYYRDAGHIARSMKTPVRSNRYAYSALAHRIAQRNKFMFVTGCTVATLAGCVAGVLIGSGRK